MRVVAAVCLLLVCSVLAPSAVLAGASEQHGQLGATVSEPSQQATVDTVDSSVQSANGSNTSSASNSSFGLQVSSFVQSTSAETSGVVENEMWEADVNRSGRSKGVSQRVDHLDRRVSTLREQRQTLVQSYENGSISTLRYQSQLARLNGQLNALSAAAGSTERAATRLDTDAPGLSKVRTEIEQSKETMPPTRRSPANPGQGNGQQAGQANPGQGNGPPTDQERSSNGDGQQADQENPGNGNGPPTDRENPGKGNGPPTDETGESAADNATTTDDNPGNAGGNSENANEGNADKHGENDSANSGNSGESNRENSPGNSDESSSGNSEKNDSGNGSESNSGNGGADSPGNSGADNSGNDGNNPDRSSVLVHL